MIAGGPGSGKSTLLQALAESGEICYEESSRVLIREQLAQAGRLVPWGDLSAFAQVLDYLDAHRHQADHG